MTKFIFSHTAVRAIWLVLILLIYSLPGASFALENKKHEIDAWLEHAPDSSTSEMIDSHKKAIVLWEEEISKQFKSLLLLVSSDQREPLQASQEVWRQFQKAEFRNIEQVMNKPGGTLAGPIALSLKLEVVRARALQLQMLKDQLQ